MLMDDAAVVMILLNPLGPIALLTAACLLVVVAVRFLFRTFMRSRD
jgi:hypothetical protein